MIKTIIKIGIYGAIGYCVLLGYRATVAELHSLDHAEVTTVDGAWSWAQSNTNTLTCYQQTEAWTNSKCAKVPVVK